MNAPRSNRSAPAREQFAALDAADRLAPLRQLFELPPEVIYLDGNSLGALPRTTSARVREVIEREWGDGLIRSWNAAHWIELPRRVGAKIARLIGAQPHEVICADSTSVNLFKVLATALRSQVARPQVSLAERRVIVSERTNFPTDLYVAQGLTQLLDAGHVLQLVEIDDIAASIDERTAVLLLTHVNFRTGAMHDMAALTRRARAAGALTVWDLSHSAGAVPVAPAFVYAAARHLAALADDPFAQPLAGWMGHKSPFDFDPGYAPAASIDRFAVGTPSILALAALDAGIDTVLAAGIDALRAKSIELSELFIALAEQRCGEFGIELVSPRDPARRGSQVCFRHPHAYAVMQALIARGVIGDFRAPDILRFGFAPLYVRFVDVRDAVDALADVLARDDWRDERYQQRQAVT
jgi:kynureninase